MSVIGEVCGVDQAGVAQGAIVAKRFVKKSTTVDGGYTAITSAGEAAHGIAWDDAADGDSVRVILIGRKLVETSAAITRGARISVSANGRAAPWVAGQVVVGIAEEAASGGGEFIHCLVFCAPQESGAQAGLIATENGKVLAFGTLTPATDGDDDVVTGLALVEECGCSLKTAPTLTHMFSSASVGDQAGAPAAGSIRILHLKPTAANDVTPVAATTPWVPVNWYAYGTL